MITLCLVEETRSVEVTSSSRPDASDFAKPIEHRGFKNFKIGEAYGDQYSNPAEPPDFVDQLSKANTKLKPPGLPITPPPPPLEMPHPPPPSYGVGGSLGFMGPQSWRTFMPQQTVNLRGVGG